MEHRILITKGPKGYRWECRCGTAGAWAPEPTARILEKGLGHEAKFNAEESRG